MNKKNTKYGAYKLKNHAHSLKNQYDKGIQMSFELCIYTQAKWSVPSTRDHGPTKQGHVSQEDN